MISLSHLRRMILPLAGLASAGCGDRRPSNVAGVGSSVATRDSTDTPFHVTEVQRARLHVITVASTDFQPIIEATGTVAFNGDRSTQVISPMSGPVVRLVAPLGANVGRGQVLATVSSPDFATALADYRKAETLLRNATRIFDRNEQLFANDALARSDLDQSRTDVAAAGADRDAAAQHLRSLGIDDAVITAIRDGKSVPLLEGAIRSPITGEVVERLITPGQLLQAGATAAFTVADLSTMWVMASIYGEDISAVQKGERVDVISDASTTPIQGRVDFVAPIVDPGTRATTVRILASNGGRVLKRDMFVRVLVHAAASRSGIVVPASAVLRDDDNLPFVFIADARGGFARRRITLGSAVEGGLEVTRGLKSGENILTDGALFVQFAEHQ
jgi:membrane fusion protein, heavy metal efflux system